MPSIVFRVTCFRNRVYDSYISMGLTAGMYHMKSDTVNNKV